MVSMKKGSPFTGKTGRHAEPYSKSAKRSSFSVKDQSSESTARGKSSGLSRGPKRYASNEKDYIFWCMECNVPLLDKICGKCGAEGKKTDLSQPADLRFCSPYERTVLHDILMSAYKCDPFADRVILLNKIPGDDKTDEVIADSLTVGILRFDLHSLDYVFEPSISGAGILLKETEMKTVVLKKNTRHLNGKKVGSDLVESMSSDIRENDFVLLKSGSLTGYGIAYCNAEDAGNANGPVLRVRKIESHSTSLLPVISTMDDIITANLPYIRSIGKNAINTIKGIVNQKEFRDLPVNVSFSGGKDSLVVLDLTLSALKNRNVSAFFLNTGIEFPETVDFVRDYCINNSIELTEKKAVSDFWDNADVFGPPAKDFRWCCKICKLAPANDAIEDCLSRASTCITVDGKRRYESFSRANISTSEKNPFVPGQLNIFPVKDWKAIEVWLYIYWRKLEYNRLYDLGFERVGCFLCPAALSAEYQRLKVLHPELYGRWESFLLEWAKNNGFSEKYMKHGLWRWKELPPKMIQLCRDMGISASAASVQSSFSVDVISGISPCKAGGYSIESSIHGFSMKKTIDVMNIIGKTVCSEELGLLVVKSDISGIKIFSSGSLVINSQSREMAESVLRDVSRQLLRAHKCTGCGICVKTCPAKAISVEDGHVIINENCVRCGKCTQSCVVLKYENKIS